MRIRAAGWLRWGAAVHIEIPFPSFCTAVKSGAPRIFVFVVGLSGAVKHFR